MRHTALRISDVALLRRDRVEDGQLLIHTKKTGATILPLPKELVDALKVVPAPRGAEQAKHFFINGGLGTNGDLRHGTLPAGRVQIIGRGGRAGAPISPYPSHRYPGERRLPGGRGQYPGYLRSNRREALRQVEPGPTGPNHSGYAGTFWVRYKNTPLKHRKHNS